MRLKFTLLCSLFSVLPHLSFHTFNESLSSREEPRCKEESKQNIYKHFSKIVSFQPTKTGFGMWTFIVKSKTSSSCALKFHQIFSTLCITVHSHMNGIRKSCTVLSTSCTITQSGARGEGLLLHHSVLAIWFRSLVFCCSCLLLLLQKERACWLLLGQWTAMWPISDSLMFAQVVFGCHGDLSSWNDILSGSRGCPMEWKRVGITCMCMSPASDGRLLSLKWIGFQGWSAILSSSKSGTLPSAPLLT